jgi:hypothetical protein
MEQEKRRDSPTELLRRTRISFLVTISLLIVFAVSYGYLEYYYINDPVQGKTANLTVRGGTHRVATPIAGGLYSYHVFPMMIIFILVGFGPFFDSISFNILGRHSASFSCNFRNAISKSGSEYLSKTFACPLIFGFNGK